MFWKAEENTQVKSEQNTQIKCNSEKANNTKYSKTKLAWFSRLLPHSAWKRGGFILQRFRAHTGQTAEWDPSVQLSCVK